MSLRLEGVDRSPYALLATALDMPEEEVRRIARAAPTLYRTRRELKPSGTYRLIQAPLPDLKKLQKRLLRWLERRASWHRAAMAGIPRGSQRRNAAAHQRRYMVATEDLVDFFPSVSPHRVKKVLESAGMQPAVAALVRTLTTRNGGLPQGAPTSALIANIVLRRMDASIADWARRNGLSYTRYIDDITISGDSDFRDKLSELREIVTRARFKLRASKSRCAGPDTEHVVTKTISVNDGIRLSTEYSARIRATWSECEELVDRGGYSEGARVRLLRLRGMIEHARYIDPGSGGELLRTFKARFPEERWRAPIRRKTRRTRAKSRI